MRIDKISIQNFRNIEQEISFDLNPQFTAFIGINGKGKSTMLHALRIASGAYFLGIPDVPSLHIQKDEIRIKESGTLLIQQFPVNVEARGIFPNVSSPVVWRRQWLKGSSSTTSKSADIGSIRKIAEENYNEIMTKGNDKIGLPVIAFFGTSRVFGAGRNTSNSRIQRLGRDIFREGYQDWDEMKASKFHYQEWLGTYETLVKLGREYDKTKEAFIQAVKKSNRYIDELDFINGELWMRTKMKENISDFLPLKFHSDGMHYYTAMTAELAYRCIVLNGYLNEMAVEKSTGVVMIDELDLHLHPTWQKHVVDDLKSAFPEIQFIVTTHSPFIVQSLSSDELINLDKDTDVNPKELGIEEVTEDIMGVESAMSDENINLENISVEYLNLIKNFKKENSIETISSLDDLELKILDPAVRAFLKMKRLENNI